MLVNFGDRDVKKTFEIPEVNLWLILMQKKQITRLPNPTLETKAPDGEYYQKPGATQGNLLETLRNNK